MGSSLDDKVTPINVAVVPSSTLMNTKMLEGERVVAEFVEEPVANTLCREGTIRRIQLTTRRVIYYETTRMWCCYTAPPLLRQVFLRDISEICVDNYSSLELNWWQQLTSALLLYASPAAGIALILAGESATTESTYSYGESSSSSSSGKAYTAIGAILIVVFAIAVVLRLLRKKVPQIIFATRCSQLPAFSIRLESADGRRKLLEETTALIHKNQ